MTGLLPSGEKTFARSVGMSSPDVNKAARVDFSHAGAFTCPVRLGDRVDALDDAVTINPEIIYTKFLDDFDCFLKRSGDLVHWDTL
jgi:hypothetical protein